MPVSTFSDVCKLLVIINEAMRTKKIRKMEHTRKAVKQLEYKSKIIEYQVIELQYHKICIHKKQPKPVYTGTG